MLEFPHFKEMFIRQTSIDILQNRNFLSNNMYHKPERQVLNTLSGESGGIISICTVNCNIIYRDHMPCRFFLLNVNLLSMCLSSVWLKKPLRKIWAVLHFGKFSVRFRDFFNNNLATFLHQSKKRKLFCRTPFLHILSSF